MFLKILWLRVNTICGLCLKKQDGNTALHILAQTQPCPSSAVSLVLQRGGHLDQVNLQGHSFAQLLENVQPIHEVVNTLQFTTLKCLCARVIRQHRLLFNGLVPQTLQPFVLKHWSGSWFSCLEFNKQKRKLWHRKRVFLISLFISLSYSSWKCLCNTRTNIGPSSLTFCFPVGFRFDPSSSNYSSWFDIVGFSWRRELSTH